MQDGTILQKIIVSKVEMLTKRTGEGDALNALQIEAACLELFQGNESHHVVNAEGDEGRRKNSQQVL